MTKRETGRTARILFALLAVGLMLATTACGGASEPADTAETDVTSSASASLPAAEAAVAEMAADAKLLLVQGDVAPTTGDKPVWTFLFGSQDSGEMYSVSVTDGNSMGATSVGTAPLEEDEWDSIPESGSWTIDSDEALQKAVDLAELKEPPATYSVLLNTYTPRASVAERSAKPMTWYVSFVVGDESETPTVIAVDAMTGEASFPE